jgi:hypothetical protein
LAELRIRECRVAFREARAARRQKTDAARYPHPDTRALPIVGARIGTISTDRRPGDIHDSGCPAAVSTANFRKKPARKILGGALTNIANELTRFY